MAKKAWHGHVPLIALPHGTSDIHFPNNHNKYVCNFHCKGCKKYLWIQFIQNKYLLQMRLRRKFQSHRCGSCWRWNLKQLSLSEYMHMLSTNLLVILEELDICRDTKCPHWNWVLLNNIQLNSSNAKTYLTLKVLNL